jgi:hypothetical protein
MTGGRIYFTINNLREIGSNVWIKNYEVKGTSFIWKRIKATNTILQAKLAWIPRNGEHIDFWKVYIMSLQLIFVFKDLLPIRDKLLQ